MRLTVPAVCALIGWSGLAGCNAFTVTPNFISPFDRGDKTVLAVSGPVAVDVESFGGDVIIKTSQDLNDKVIVRVDKQAVFGWKRRKEGKASLDTITSSIELVPGEFGPVVKVRATTTDPEPYFQRAHVSIVAREIQGVTVSTNRGKVYVVGLSGPVHITTTEGDVRVMTNEPMTDPVVVVNKEGSIDYRVRGDSKGAIDAQTIRGQVVQRVLKGHLSKVEPGSERKLSATLNDGTNPIQLRTVDGDIRIAVLDDPTAVGIYIFDP